jgi:hypothetical protein
LYCCANPLRRASNWPHGTLSYCSEDWMFASCLSAIELPAQPAVTKQDAKTIMFQRIDYAPF